MHFTVPQQVNDSDLSHGAASLPAYQAEPAGTAATSDELLVTGPTPAPARALRRDGLVLPRGQVQGERATAGCGCGAHLGPEDWQRVPRGPSPSRRSCLTRRRRGAADASSPPSDNGSSRGPASNAVDRVVCGGREGREGREGRAQVRRGTRAPERTLIVRDFGFRGISAANKLRNYHDHGPDRDAARTNRTERERAARRGA